MHCIEFGCKALTEAVTNSSTSSFPKVPCLANPLVLQPALGVARLCAGYHCCQISPSLGLSLKCSRCPKMCFGNIHNKCSWSKKRQGKNLISVLLVCPLPQVYLCCWLPVASSAILKSTTALKNRAILLEAFHIFMLGEALDKIKF